MGCNKDEAGYFMWCFGEEAFKIWAASRKEWKYNSLPEDDKALAESFLKSVKGESYEPDSRLFENLWFKSPLIRLSENQTMAGGKAYTYYFTPESSLPYMKCGHETELPTVLKHPEHTLFTGRAFDETFSKTMRKMWVQFAKTGNPSLSADISPDGKEKIWPLYDLKDRQVMVFDEFNIHPEKECDVKIVDWERLYPLTKYYWL